MKNLKITLSLLLVMLLSMSVFAACGSDKNESSTGSESSDTTSSAEVSDIGTSAVYGEGLDSSGYFAGVKAIDCVDLKDADKISIPNDSVVVAEDEVQAKIDEIANAHNPNKTITDRAVVDGDTVNIDYVGSIDGVEFAGGSTGGNGTEVIIGVTSYIDDFLEQLIGHKPGETFNVEVTFPDDYQSADVAGKDAVFVTTINHIVSSDAPTVDDDFVASNLKEEFSWSNLAEMKKGVENDLIHDNKLNYINQNVLDFVEVKSVPQNVKDYQTALYKQYYQDYADQYGVELDEFISTYTESENLEKLLEDNDEYISAQAKSSLALQAISEKQNILATDKDVDDYLTAEFGESNLSILKDYYGMAYLRQMTTRNMVVEYLVENSTVA